MMNPQWKYAKRQFGTLLYLGTLFVRKDVSDNNVVGLVPVNWVS